MDRRSVLARLMLLAASGLAVAGCVASTESSGAADGDSSVTSEERLGLAESSFVELGSRTPLPYILQFVGTYENAAASNGQVKKLTLLRNGHYSASIVGKQKIEHGAFFAVSQLAHDPSDNALRFVTAGLAWTGTIEGYSSKLELTRAGSVTHVTAKGSVGPNESLCDASHGSWTDDDVDPSTGLY